MFDTMLSRDIRQTLEDFRRSVDQLFFDEFGKAGTWTSAGAFLPAIETTSNESELQLRVVLPGVTAQDVNATVQNGRLIIDGERKAPEGWGENAFTRMPYGKFHAEIALPNGLDLDKISCRLADGVMHIQVPFSEAAQPRQIRIEGADSQKSLPASA